ncbi:hypothetical protein Sjap_020545 [Stephania japonica]|uniref:40S ribosomal protein S12 n=1 Tax=Stephania japonica TaxID=461633 RepID=A0AAP0I0D5_9MAGN
MRTGEEKALVVILSAYLNRVIKKHVAQLCVLAEDYDQADYAKLVKALCVDNNVNLITVPSAKNSWRVGHLCKIDSKGKARKVVGCSCIVVKARNQLLIAGIRREIAQPLRLAWEMRTTAQRAECRTEANIKDYGEESEGLHIVQEYVKSHLALLLARNEYYAWGLRQIAKAVSFLNNDCKLCVVVTQTLDCKLHAFDVLSEFDGNSQASGPMLGIDAILILTLFYQVAVT